MRNSPKCCIFFFKWVTGLYLILPPLASSVLSRRLKMRIPYFTAKRGVSLRFSRRQYRGRLRISAHTLQTPPPASEVDHYASLKVHKHRTYCFLILSDLNVKYHISVFENVWPNVQEDILPLSPRTGFLTNAYNENSPLQIFTNNKTAIWTLAHGSRSEQSSADWQHLVEAGSVFLRNPWELWIHFISLSNYIIDTLHCNCCNRTWNVKMSCLFGELS